jgi:hypothetical protein
MITHGRMLVAIGGVGALAAAGPGSAGVHAKLTVPTDRPKGTMEIKPSGSQPSGQGPADYVTGAICKAPLFQAISMLALLAR